MLRSVSLFAVSILVCSIAHARVADPSPAQRVLDRIMPAITFQQVPIEEVLSFVGKIIDTGGVKIDVDWAALEKAGIDRNAPVTLDARNVKLSKVFDEMFVNIGADKRLTYTPDDKTIRISVAQK